MGVEFDDERMSYIVAQVYRTDVVALREALREAGNDLHGICDDCCSEQEVKPVK